MTTDTKRIMQGYLGSLYDFRVSDEFKSLSEKEKLGIIGEIERVEKWLYKITL